MQRSIIIKYLPVLLLAGLLVSCGESEEGDIFLNLLSIEANGISLQDGTINVDANFQLEMAFSAAIDAAGFENNFTIQNSAGMELDKSIRYTNANSKVIVEATLDFDTQYTLRINTGVIGQAGGRLSAVISRQFSSVDGGVIRTLDPCVSASAACLRSIQLQSASGNTGSFSYYASFPLNQENTRLEGIRQAIIVQHGRNRNADDYFTYMMATLRNQGLENNTLLIAPFFKASSEAQGGEFYWGSDWREGQNSEDGRQMSSFRVIDQILAQLADTNRFPELSKVLITGHSSGALLTHAYATANQSEGQYPEIEFYYGVANSQYFYYPDDLRYDANTQQYVAVNNCARYKHWPLGAVNLPPYANAISETVLDQQMIGRKITYLLGDNDVVTTGTLNTSDCEAVLLGENRFIRGENIFRWMEETYSGSHAHQKVVVSGVGHNAQEMYASPEFISWLNGLF